MKNFFLQTKESMVNTILCVSSLVFMIVHQCLFWYVPSFPQLWLYQICLWTSIWNHGTTSFVAKWSDRLMVYIGITHSFYSFLFLYPSWIGLILTSNGMMFYMVSKTYDDPCMKNKYHIISHACATLSNIVLGIVFQKQSLT